LNNENQDDMEEEEEVVNDVLALPFGWRPDQNNI
jgi:hypothetical protein